MHFAGRILPVGLALLLGCEFPGGTGPTLVRQQRLQSGKTVSITGVNLTFGARDNVGNDSFRVEYTCSNPQGSQQDLNTEASEVFDLIRPISEQWGLKTASLEAFPTEKHTGKFTAYHFKRQANGQWASEKINGVSY